MREVRTTGQQAPSQERSKEVKWPRSAAFYPALCACIAAGILAGLLLFYSAHYSIHQDLAASALSGRLAVVLGESFKDYSLYFPPAERVWFSAAARLSDTIGLRLDLTVVLMTSLAVLISSSLAFRIRQMTMVATPLFFLLPVLILTILPILFKNVFGLREHIVALGLWPYLVLRVSDPEGTLISWRLRLLVGLWMGATLLLKYLYSIVVFFIELADSVLQRRAALLFRIENLAAGAIVALYLLRWLILDPAQRTVISAVVSAIDANLADRSTNLWHLADNLYFAIFMLIACRLFKLPGRVSAIGFALVVGAIVAAWTQQRWYSHHLFAIIMAYAAWWWMAGTAFKWWAHAVVTLYLFAPISHEHRKTAPYQKAVNELEAALNGAGLSVAGKRVGILTMHPSPYNQVLASKGSVRWNASANNSYVASELKLFDKKENALTQPPPVKLQDPGRRMLHDEMLRLWEDYPAEVLILDHSTRWPLRYVDVEWTHVFSEDPRFNAILRRYRPVLRHDGEHLEFTYYVRAD